MSALWLFIVIYKFFYLSLQIRQEKPYYVADPEVDSLVSILINAPLSAAILIGITRADDSAPF